MKDRILGRTSLRVRRQEPAAVRSRSEVPRGAVDVVGQLGAILPASDGATCRDLARHPIFRESEMERFAVAGGRLLRAAGVVRDPLARVRVQQVDVRATGGLLASKP